MIYTDKLYGKVKIQDPAVIELIHSDTLQRLKGIDQAGYTKPYFPQIKQNRFQHSLGVFILLKKFGVPLEEQIAGLLHDVSHSAFSHSIDYIFGHEKQKTQKHQDNIFADFVKKSEIPTILKKYHLNLNYILNEENFPLKESELPDLCADRLDYSLRVAVVFGEISLARLNYFLNQLLVIDQRWIFKNYASAQKFADLFRLINTKYLSSFLSAVMFGTVGNYLRHALKSKYIKITDLYKTDQKVIKKINQYLKNDKKLQEFWQKMNYRVPVGNNPSNYDQIVYCKSRLVDPLFLTSGKIIRVSEINSVWKKELMQESKPKKYFLKFESRQ